MLPWLLLFDSRFDGGSVVCADLKSRSASVNGADLVLELRWLNWFRFHGCSGVVEDAFWRHDGAPSMVVRDAPRLFFFSSDVAAVVDGGTMQVATHRCIHISDSGTGFAVGTT